MNEMSILYMCVSVVSISVVHRYPISASFEMCNEITFPHMTEVQSCILLQPKKREWM
jgi:hypothetical protein